MLFFIVVNIKNSLAQSPTFSPPKVDIVLPSIPKIPPIPSQRLIVKFKPETTNNQKEQIKRNFNITLKEKIDKINVEVVTASEERNIGEIISALSRDNRIEYIEPDFIATKVSVPNDSLYSQQWGLAKIQTPQAWDVVSGSSNVDIAILDTGVDPNHPDLKNKLTLGSFKLLPRLIPTVMELLIIPCRL